MSVLSPAGWLAAALVSVLAMPPAQAPASATFGGGERYTLPAGAVAPKDLYVIAGEATIDGTVEGDLLVIARRVRVGGTGGTGSSGGVIWAAPTVRMMPDVRPVISVRAATMLVLPFTVPVSRTRRATTATSPSTVPSIVASLAMTYRSLGTTAPAGSS